MGPYDKHKLLIANRGEIAVRIIRTAKRLGLRTVAIYTPADALAPHVLLADEAAPLPVPASEALAYLAADSIIAICRARGAALVHPGYGFLAEDADFARAVGASGIAWVGPRADVIRLMGVKHAARKAALDAGVAVVPGSEGLVASEEEALIAARKCGFPVMLKATAGGGGMGMAVCQDELALKNNFSLTTNRARSLFNNEGVFVERYYPAARHIEIQVFGNGLGDVVHMRERECSVQRRHQKVIEESPSPFCLSHPGLRERMCEVAVELARSINYDSAGTVEFLVDEATAEFFFLEMNTRIQVEHPVTEEIHSGLDLVELMVNQAIAQSDTGSGLPSDSLEMQQATYDNLYERSKAAGRSHAIEGRIYAENPYEGFIPAPGLLQHVSLTENKADWLRVDTWVYTGMLIIPHFDPLIAKFIVTGSTRDETLGRFLLTLSAFKISGPPNNVQYLEEIGKNEKFRAGLATTTFLADFSVNPWAFKVLSSGIEGTIQDLPGRMMRLGMPRSGPMDDLAFSAGNILVGNPRNTEGLEIIVVPGFGFSLQFFVAAVVSVTGKNVAVKVNGLEMPLWSRVMVPANAKFEIQARSLSESATGLRTYICIRGGFPHIPAYLGSKSTSMGLGGYQGRSLMKGDVIQLNDNCSVTADDIRTLPVNLVPVYPTHWVVYVLAGPHDDEEFITPEGIDRFYSTHWRISPSSNRLGIRLEAPTSSDKIQWARESGGEGGSHPSNILDNGYAPGTININGDTPVILTKEGPDMGGYLCMCTVATAEMYVKLGQLTPGSTVEFRRISWEESLRRSSQFDAWLESVSDFAALSTPQPLIGPGFMDVTHTDTSQTPVLHRRSSISQNDTSVCFRQAGDSAILVEFGPMKLDVFVRARIHAFQVNVQAKSVPGIGVLCPCIRSILASLSLGLPLCACCYDPRAISQSVILQILIKSENDIPKDMYSMEFPGRRITFPIVLDDKWNKDALQRYMSTTRDRAVYLPSNVEYLAKNNGLSDSNEALQKLVQSDWLVLGVGFYLACPFLIPIDPRCRLIGQKMNPSRTFTPRGAIGIAGPVAAIYPIESPGGYQLYGRTLPGWQTWGKGKDFTPSKPWLLEAFDQVHFKPVTEDEYVELERKFDAGQYSFEIEHVTFSIEEHSRFLDSIADEIDIFRRKQKEGSNQEEIKERALLQQWESQKNSSTVDYNNHGPHQVTASLFATVWRIKCKPGGVIHSESDVLVILEAMKTEIPVLAGEDNVGKTIQRFGYGIKEGSSVIPGETLLVLN
ncbi:hypothetical protein HYPSUDRAFT_147969 [Hypholoma sublateritium FD-334 SS-4]|uniref:Urea carboxylase n=1 Tax=Hypholoma sublateritium (strain FD-334 SS-4) TaxID=945553 RepID=A0A0D2NAR4_HYPSF|nr:hypothetical protein HYPSUDRAFT_147969 [Hypholoma sublateritium FD-334 SS-4]